MKNTRCTNIRVRSDNNSRQSCYFDTYVTSQTLALPLGFRIAWGHIAGLYRDIGKENGIAIGLGYIIILGLYTIYILIAKLPRASRRNSKNCGRETRIRKGLW